MTNIIMILVTFDSKTIIFLVHGIIIGIAITFITLHSCDQEDGYKNKLSCSYCGDKS